VALESFDVMSTPASGTFVAVDCDLDKTGIQDRCMYSVDADAIEVGYVVASQATVCAGCTLSAFDFVLHDDDTSRLDPPVGRDINLNANPDFNDAVHVGEWACLPPLPDNNRLPDDAGVAESFLSCFNASGSVATPLLPGSRVLAATVRYEVPETASPGVAHLTLGDASAGDIVGVPLVSCGGGNVIGECLDATITLVDPDPPTAVPTATSTPTGTATPAATNTPVPTFTRIAFVTVTPSPTRTSTPAATNTSVPTATATRTPVAHRCADVTGDGRVSGRDIAEIARNLRRRYDPQYDINRDGRVNLFVVVAAFRQLGRRC
jgi:hypothetical protein